MSANRTPQKPKYKGNFPGQVDQSSAVKPGSGLGNGTLTYNWKWTCLLYTSDAADE